MMSEHELDRRLRELGEHLRSQPSPIDAVMQRVEQAEIAPGTRTRRYRLMQLKSLKWIIPFATAAAVVLIVGLWRSDRKPGIAQPGRLYAMSDVPALLKAARTLHIQGKAYRPDPARPGEYLASPVELWLDVQGARSRLRKPTDPDKAAAGIPFIETVCDGEFVMDDQLKKPRGGKWIKTVHFKRLTPYQAALQARLQEHLFTGVFANADQLAGFTKTGQELIGGEAYDVWEGELTMLGYAFRLKVWLMPTTGQLGRVLHWLRQPGGQDWIQGVELDRIDRDVELPDELFSTEPAPDAVLANAKADAPTELLGGDEEMTEDYALRVPISFTLPDGIVLVAWSCQDKKNPDQGALFAGLTPGAELPKLPAQIISLAPVPVENPTPCIGRHLTYTQKSGRYFEWSIYVAPGPAPLRNSFLAYNADVHYTVPQTRFSTWTESISNDLPIQSTHEFDRWVRGAMADLSENAQPPDGITYEGVLQLASEIRPLIQSVIVPRTPTPTPPDPAAQRQVDDVARAYAQGRDTIRHYRLIAWKLNGEGKGTAQSWAARDGNRWRVCEPCIVKTTAIPSDFETAWKQLSMLPPGVTAMTYQGRTVRILRRPYRQGQEGIEPMWANDPPEARKLLAQIGWPALPKGRYHSRIETAQDPRLIRLRVESAWTDPGHHELHTFDLDPAAGYLCMGYFSATRETRPWEANPQWRPDEPTVAGEPPRPADGGPFLPDKTARVLETKTTPQGQVYPSLISGKNALLSEGKRYLLGGGDEHQTLIQLDTTGVIDESVFAWPADVPQPN